VVFLTAYYGLADLTQVTPGERILIHAGTGGVGMAAIQLARHWGAEVYATTSPAKWGVLRALGVDDEHLASSRDLDFADRFTAATGGEGVDIVLNSLAGEYIDASLSLLPRGGRFLEMGKTAIRDAGEIAAAHANVFYRAYDMIEAGPERIQSMLTELVELFEAGALRPLPTHALDVRQAPRAFRFLQQARHTGKLVLTLPRPLDPEGTVLITGGTGTIGAHTARYLVKERGVRYLLLLSRRGPDAPGAVDLVAELTGLGAEVTVTACDAADADRLAATLAEIPAAHPLTAIFHSAGALRDATVTTLTPEHLTAVFASKIDAAWNLHRLTLDLDLAAFVLYTSASGVIGSPGQANYAAANAHLDALAQHRRALGLPAMSLAWGLWAETSEMTGSVNATARRRMASGGVLPLPTDQALDLLDASLSADGETVQVPVLLDRTALRAGGEQVPPVLRDLTRGAGRRSARSGDPAKANELRDSLAGLTEADQHDQLLDLVRRHVAATLGHRSPGDVEPGRAFQAIGFDSLTAVELRNRLNTAAGVRLPATVIFDYPTPTALAAELRRALAPEAAASGPESVLAELDRIESAVRTLDAQDDGRARVAIRLRALLRGLAADQPDDAESEGLDAATDDELFQVLDDELGVL
jgi:NADPH:quinone reductase-like Zn-dependent oxidoreductase